MKQGARYIVALMAAAAVWGAAPDAEAKPKGEITETKPGVSTVIVSNPAQALQDDIEVSSLVFYQELRLLEAGQAVEDCLYGRSSFAAAQKTVAQCRQQAESLSGDLQQYQRLHPNELARVALQLWEKRREILIKMEKLLQTGKIERPALRAFQEQNGEMTRQVIVKWLGAKDKWAQAGIQLPKSAARQYYEWQTIAIPAQKQMCIHSQHLLEMSSALANGKRFSLQEAQAIQTSLAELKNSLSQQKVAKPLQDAHRALINETSALSRLTEAIIILNKDRTPDASARVERCNKQLRRASLRSGQTALEALKSCRSKQ
ncbi:MAG: hypothetical protein Q4F00_08020 [bacterium]|nr:hypothetical protein [bacterium]